MRDHLRMYALWAAVTATGACVGDAPGDLEPDDLGPDLSTLVSTGRVQAEAYRAGGEGVGYHDTTSTNLGHAYRTDAVDIEAGGTGYDVGWTAPGEWLAYDITFAQAGHVTATLRLASTYAAQSLHVEIDGANVSGALQFSGTSWTAYADVPADLGSVTAGTHTVKVVFDSGHLNLDYFDLASASAPPAGFAVGGSYSANADPGPIEARAGVPFATSRTYWSPTGQAGAVARVKADIAAGRRISHISFKLPYSWALMATGSGDTWAKDLSSQLQAAIAGTNHSIVIAMHHEPENDTGTNPGNTAAGRDAWKNMQARLAPFFDKPGITYVLILMGYHSFLPASNLYPLWKLDQCVPSSAAIKGIGYDMYETYGANGSTKFKDYDALFTQVKAFHGPRGLAWGLSETGVTDAAFTAKPTWFADVIAKEKTYGGSWFDYFNSNLNSTSDWAMPAGSPREKAFIKVLQANP